MIKITCDNAEKIETALAAANGGATAHTYTQYADLARLAANAEVKLDGLGIPKSMRAGAGVFAVWGERVPTAYKYSCNATSARLVRRASGWYLDSASATTLQKEGGKVDLLLTGTQDERAVAQFRKAYIILKGEQV